MLAALEKRTVHTGSNNRCKAALLEAVGRGGPHRREPEEQAQWELRQHLAGGEEGEIGLEKAAGVEVNRTPHRARVRAVEEEMRKRLRDDPASRAVAQQAAGVGWATAATHVIRIVEHTEEGVTNGGGDVVSMQQMSEAGGDIGDVAGAANRQ